MTQLEDKLLFLCARTAFSESHRQQVYDLCLGQTVDWDKVYSTAHQHGIAPLVFTNLQQCNPAELGLPQEIINQFRLSFTRNISTKAYIAEKLSELLAFFEQRSLEVMVIKGSALDIVVYNRPWYTFSNDVDLIVKVQPAQISAQNDQEIKTFLNGFPGFEYEYFEHHDVSINGVLPINFSQIWADATKTTFREHPVWVMSPEDMLISACINSCRKRFFRLKALCDIAEIIVKFQETLNWTLLLQKAKAYDCSNIVYTALLVTQITVGCELPTDLLDQLKVGPLRATLIHFLSQRMSLSAFDSLFSAKNFRDKKIDWSLLLSYATFRNYQIWQNINVALPFIEPWSA